MRFDFMQMIVCGRGYLAGRPYATMYKRIVPPA